MNSQVLTKLLGKEESKIASEHNMVKESVLIITILRYTKCFQFRDAAFII